jgi:translation initiation factor 6
MIIRKNFFGAMETVGVFIAATDTYFLYPPILKRKASSELEEAFGVKGTPTTIGNGRVIGAYVAGNSRGMLVPGIIMPEEMDKLQNAYPDVKIGVIDSLDNALGNLVLCNDKGAVISFKLQDFKQLISDTLGVPVRVGKFGGTDLVGSAGLANDSGAVIHPLANDADCESISEVLSVPVDISTVNCGIPYVGACAVVNNRALVVGKETTGPELQRLSQMLNL